MLDFDKIKKESPKALKLWLSIDNSFFNTFRSSNFEELDLFFDTHKIYPYVAPFKDHAADVNDGLDYWIGCVYQRWSDKFSDRKIAKAASYEQAFKILNDELCKENSLWNMSQEEIREIVIPCVVSPYDKNINTDINGSTRFKDVGIDSLDIIGLVMELDAKFSISIGDEQDGIILGRNTTIDDMVKIIFEKLKLKKP